MWGEHESTPRLIEHLLENFSSRCWPRSPREIDVFRNSGKLKKIYKIGPIGGRPFRQSWAGILENLKLLAVHCTCHRSKLWKRPQTWCWVIPYGPPYYLPVCHRIVYRYARENSTSGALCRVFFWLRKGLEVGGAHFSAALVIWPLPTHPFWDGLPFLLLLETHATFLGARCVSFFLIFHNIVFSLILPPFSSAVCGHHLSPRTAILVSLSYRPMLYPHFSMSQKGGGGGGLTHDTSGDPSSRTWNAFCDLRFTSQSNHTRVNMRVGMIFVWIWHVFNWSSLLVGAGSVRASYETDTSFPPMYVVL